MATVLEFAKRVLSDEVMAEVGTDEAIALARLETAFEDVRDWWVKEEAKVESLTTQLNLARDEVKTLNLSRGGSTIVIDPEALADRADVTLSRIDLALEKRDITKAQAEELRKAVKPGGNPSVVMLSRMDGIDARPVDFFLKLAAMRPVASKATVEQSGVQLLARDTPGGDDDKPARGKNPWMADEPVAAK